MATNVRKKMPAESTLYLLDVIEDVCNGFKKELEDSGPIDIVNSAKELAMKASTIISMVPTPENVREIYLDRVKGVAAAKDSLDADTASQKVYCECSTIDIETTKEVGEALAKMGMGTYVDAPVSGGPAGAQNATLSMMVGMPESSSPIQGRVDTIVKYMGSPSKIFYCGGLGLGLAGKLTNNYISCTLCSLNAEAMATAIKLGLERNLAYRIIDNSSGQNWMLSRKNPAPGIDPAAPSSNNYTPNFRVPLAVKDISLGIQAAKSVGVEPAIGEAAVSVLQKLAEDEKYKVRRALRAFQIFTDRHAGPGPFCRLSVFGRSGIRDLLGLEPYGTASFFDSLMYNAV